jgi:hypothetical protein
MFIFDLKNMILIHSKDFGEQKIALIHLILNFFLKGSQNMTRILKLFYFHIWSITKNWLNLLVMDWFHHKIERGKKHTHTHIVNIIK